MEDLKDKLYENIEKYSLTDPIIIALSQELDEYVVKQQRELYERN